MSNEKLLIFPHGRKLLHQTVLQRACIGDVPQEIYDRSEKGLTGLTIGVQRTMLLAMRFMYTKED